MARTMSINLSSAVFGALLATTLAALAADASAGDALSARTAEIARAAEALRPRLVETRRDFHQHPELSNREERTARVVAERLRALGLDEVRTNVAGHGVVALLKGARPGPVVALRADLDALPINETLDVPYKSLVPGVKHACGHDAHTTIELGVAEILSKMRGQIHGAVQFLFMAAECVTALQAIKSRRIDTFEPVIITVGSFHGGKSPHVTPAEVVMQGTVRTFHPDVRKQIEQLIRETLAGITAAYGASFDLEYKTGTMVVFNDPKLVEESLPSIRRAVGDSNVFEFPMRMGAEDFSYYQEVIPGFFLRLGSGNKAKGITADSHSPEFDIDEECLVTGAKVMANLALDFLDRHSAR